MKILEAIKDRLDNWQNLLTGLGTARDKTRYGQFIRLGYLDDETLTSLYHQNDTARKIVAFKPREMMRSGFTVDVEDEPEQGKAVLDKLSTLNANTAILDAMIWGRLYGGAVVLIGADDGALSMAEPLNESAIRTVRYLQVVDRRFVQPQNVMMAESTIYSVGSPVGGSNVMVHRSRLLLFGGAHTAPIERQQKGGWDCSVLDVVHDTLRAYDEAWASTSHLMADAEQGVFKIKGFLDMLAGGNKDLLQTRMQVVDMSRSVARAIMLDADANESFTREHTSFTEIHALLDKWMMRIASAAEIPVTILMGRSPAGLNATGDADFRAFYDTVASDQESILRPYLERLVRLVLLAKDGPTHGQVPLWSMRFKSLWRSTPKEQAELETLHATKDVAYVNAGIVLPEEVALSRFRPDGWESQIVVDRELREQALTVPEPSEPTEPGITTEPVAEVETLSVPLAPTDMAAVVSVNEVRRTLKLPPVANGDMSVAAYRARFEAPPVAEPKVDSVESPDALLKAVSSAITYSYLMSRDDMPAKVRAWATEALASGAAEDWIRVNNPPQWVADEECWAKAKRAAEHAGSDNLYAFAAWWYIDHMGCAML